MKLGNIISDIHWALRSIFSYKRRSLATGAGLILGAAILSSIFFYGSMINAIAIQDLLSSPEADLIAVPAIENYPSNLYEISMKILSHKEVSSATLQYVYSSSSFADVRPIMFPATINDTDELSIIYEEDTRTYNPVIVSDSGLEDGQFKQLNIVRGTADLSGNSCLLDNWYFRHMNIHVNDILTLNFSIITYYSLSLLYTTNISLKVSGFYTSKTVYRTRDIILAAHNVNQTVLDIYRSYGLYRWVIKLDYNNLPVNSATNLQKAINALAFTLEQETNNQIKVSDLVSEKLSLLQLQSTIMQIIDATIYIPAIILSLMLVNFGIELALQERKYEIAVLKAQGASPKQIRRAIIIEVLLIGLIGELIGIVLGIFGAATVVSSYTFMSINFSTFGAALRGLRITAVSIIVPIVITIGIVLFQSIRKTNTFIAQEVALAKYIEKRKKNWFKRIYGDIIFFVLGLVGVALTVAKDIDPSISYGFWPTFLQFFSPLIIWYGSAGVVSRISTKVPEVLDKYLVKFFKDIGLLFKGSLARRHQNLPRVTVMLTLAISLSFLAAIQGETSIMQIKRQTDYHVGGDIILTIDTASLLLTKDNFTGLQDKIEQIIPIYHATLYASMKMIDFYGANLTQYGKYALWHKDSFRNYKDWNKALSILEENPTRYFAINQEGYLLLGIKQNPVISLNTENTAETFQAEAKLVLDHAPGGIGANVFNPVCLVDKTFLLTHAKNYTSIVSAIVILKNGVNADKENLPYYMTNYTFVSDAYTYNEVYNELKKSQARYFGIPGLLTIDYIVAIITSVIGVFIFMFTIINRRKQEFAILIAEGASPIQIVKLVFSEIISIAVFSTIFGSGIGFLLGYQFNSFFGLFELVPFHRRLAFPLMTLVFSVIGSFLAILIAALLPAIAASKVKVVEEMRVL